MKMCFVNLNIVTNYRNLCMQVVRQTNKKKAEIGQEHEIES